MANLRVELSEQARKQLHAIDAWWSENRPASPDLFARELTRWLAILAEHQAAGVSSRHPRLISSPVLAFYGNVPIGVH